MKLRFIGSNGSMGLIRGHVYDVEIRTVDRYICVIFEDGRTCPYETIRAFTDNWHDPCGVNWTGRC